MTNLEVIVENLLLLKKQSENTEVDVFWEDDCGCDLTDMIVCHSVFLDSTPCLNDLRKAKYDSPQYYANCSECKANWLLEDYE